MSKNTKKLVTLAMLAALAYAVMYVTRPLPPIVLIPPLKLDPKDVILVIGGFLFGPLPMVATTFVVCLLEMVTVSTTGPYGLLMNFVASCAFICPAAFVYKKKRSMKGAVIGLVLGVLAMTAMMLLWNYIITPWYAKIPRAAVADMLIPVFLPFNLLKAGINATITMLLYKPVVLALRRSGLLPTPATQKSGGKINLGTTLAAGLALLTLVLLLLVFMGIL